MSASLFRVAANNKSPRFSKAQESAAGAGALYYAITNSAGDPHDDTRSNVEFIQMGDGRKKSDELDCIHVVNPFLRGGFGI